MILILQIWKFKLPGDMSCGPIMELIIYVGVYFMSFPLSLKHIRDSYRDRTGKMRSFFEVRFMSRHTVCNNRRFD